MKEGRAYKLTYEPSLWANLCVEPMDGPMGGA